MRGPSGRGASRLARAGVLDCTSSTASKRNEVMAVVSCASAVRWGEMQAGAVPVFRFAGGGIVQCERRGNGIAAGPRLGYAERAGMIPWGLGSWRRRLQPVAKVPWYEGKSAGGLVAVARRGVRRMAIRVISSDERQSRRPRNKKTSVARRVTRRFRPTKKKARRARQCVPGAATRYTIGPGARNAACVIFATGCLPRRGSRTFEACEPEYFL